MEKGAKLSEPELQRTAYVSGIAAIPQFECGIGDPNAHIATTASSKNARVPLSPASAAASLPRLWWPKGHGDAVDPGPCRREGFLFRCFYWFG